MKKNGRRRKEAILKTDIGLRTAPGHNGQRPRVSTGVDRLDAITQGGFLSGKTYLLSGMPGTGKSIFALQFLRAGLAAGRNGIYVCVNEKPEDLIATATSLGWDIEAAVTAGSIRFLDMSPFFSRFNVKSKNVQDQHGTEINIRKFLIEMSKYARGISAEFLVIDSVNSILPASEVSHADNFAQGLALAIEQYLDCTSLLTYAYWQENGSDKLHPIESHVSGVLNLGLVRTPDGFERTLCVKKMRATAIEPSMHRFVIESVNGISLLGNPGRSETASTGDNGNRRRRTVRHKDIPDACSAILLKD